MQDIYKARWLNKVILVVEDDNFNYQYIDALLSGKGLNLIHAKTGEEAIKICKSDQKIDLILMDINLPFMSGYEATKEIRTLRTNLPIIAQTAYALSEDQIMCKKAGCDHYISKPIDIEEILSAFSKYLND